MAAPYWNLNSKVEQALQGYLLTIFPGANNIFTGKSAADKSLPCAICDGGRSSEEDPRNSGNYWVDAEVMVKYNAHPDVDGVDHKADSDSLTAQVIDALQVDDLATLLSSQITDFTVHGLLYESMESTQDDDVWSDSIKLRVYCSPSDL